MLLNLIEKKIIDAIGMIRKKNPIREWNTSQLFQKYFSREKIKTLT